MNAFSISMGVAASVRETLIPALLLAPNPQLSLVDFDAGISGRPVVWMGWILTIILAADSLTDLCTLISLLSILSFVFPNNGQEE